MIYQDYLIVKRKNHQGKKKKNPLTRFLGATLPRRGTHTAKTRVSSTLTPSFSSTRSRQMQVQPLLSFAAGAEARE